MAGTNGQERVLGDRRRKVRAFHEVDDRVPLADLASGKDGWIDWRKLQARVPHDEGLAQSRECLTHHGHVIEVRRDRREVLVGVIEIVSAQALLKMFNGVRRQDRITLIGPRRREVRRGARPAEIHRARAELPAVE